MANKQPRLIEYIIIDWFLVYLLSLSLAIEDVVEEAELLHYKYFSTMHPLFT